MKHIGKTLLLMICLLSAFLLGGCGGKTAPTDATTGADSPTSTGGATSAQSQAAGEKNSEGQAQHYQEMQQKKQQGSGQ